MVYRARCNCPSCNYTYEIWLDQGKTCFDELVTCDRCNTLYDPLDFISQFLELRTNATISSKLIHSKV
jgi:hypothetical protein